MTTADLDYTFSGLSDASIYKFEVIAVYDYPDSDNKESAMENIDVFSSPLPPTPIDPTEVTILFLSELCLLTFCQGF